MEKIKELINLCKKVGAKFELGQDPLWNTTHEVLEMPVEKLSDFLTAVEIFGSVSVSYQTAYVYVSSLNLTDKDKETLKAALK